MNNTNNTSIEGNAEILREAALQPQWNKLNEWAESLNDNDNANNTTWTDVESVCSDEENEELTAHQKAAKEKEDALKPQWDKLEEWANKITSANSSNGSKDSTSSNKRLILSVVGGFTFAAVASIVYFIQPISNAILPIFAWLKASAFAPAIAIIGSSLGLQIGLVVLLTAVIATTAYYAISFSQEKDLGKINNGSNPVKTPSIEPTKDGVELKQNGQDNKIDPKKDVDSGNGIKPN